MTLAGKKILLGVGGGIAAYKSAILLRELMRRGAEVRVVVTDAAARFVGDLTFAGLSGRPPIRDLWDPSYPGEIHVELSEWADLAVIAPATANLIARMAIGRAEDVLSATLLCFDGPVLCAPAMHERMWRAPATERNVERVVADGVHLIGPEQGALASGQQGMGRMSEPEQIAERVQSLLVERDLSGRKMLISAGPTHEDLDPVRFLGNRSSGKMGYALASQAVARGAEVVLISGPTEQALPAGVARVDVRSAIEMAAAIDELRTWADAIFMAAAVADYRPTKVCVHKLKKKEGPMTLTLERNPDILASLGERREGASPLLVGFAVETQNLLASARAKLEKKGVDLIVANEAAVSFGRDHNTVVLVSRDAERALPELPKREVANRILDWVVSRWAGGDDSPYRSPARS